MHILMADWAVDRDPRLEDLDGEVLSEAGLAAAVRAPRQPDHARSCECRQA